MMRLALRQLVSQRTATALALLGLLTATLGFVVLASTSQTTTAVMRGDLRRAWPTPYDILVRPPGREAALERQQGLVRPNFLSGLVGGITERQLEAVRSVPGVEAAAPLAVLGSMYWPTRQTLDLSGMAGDADVTVFRITQSRIGDAGSSSYPTEQVTYAVAARGGEVQRLPDGNDSLRVDGTVVRCTQDCYAPRADCRTEPLCPDSVGTWAWAFASLDQPVVVAGVDPEQEAKVAGLDRCLSEGRYLDPADRPDRVRIAGGQGSGVDIPVLVSQRSFIDETLHVRVERALDPPLAASSSQLVAGIGDWTVASEWSLTADGLYRETLARPDDPYVGAPIFVAGDVTYRPAGDRLEAQVVTPAESTFSGYPAPPEAADRWFRDLTSWRPAGDALPVFRPIGQYDPTCLASLDPLAGGGLEEYAPPLVTLPDGRRLGPNASPAGYVDSPPTFLTTLAGVKGLLDRQRPEAQHDPAYISAIRVRAAGVGEPGPVAEARLTRLAAAIEEATGLQVDVVKGASPRSVRVDLPAGRFGRPEQTVTEPWSVKGVGFVFSRAVSAQDLALFLLVLVGAGVLIGQTAYTSVRRRRPELGMLRALGWPQWRVLVLVELEMLLLALGAGLSAVVLGLALARATRLQVGLLQVALTLPLALALTAAASLPPALSAARGGVLRVLERGVRARSSRPLLGVAHLGLRDLLRQSRWEAALGVGAVAIGAALVGGVLLISTAFRGQFDTTVLGAYMAGRVRPFHAVLAALTLVVGAIAAAEIVTLGYLERRPQLGVLRALGWPRRQLSALVAAQAAALGAGGGLLGALVTLGVGWALSAPPGPVLTGVGGALVTAVLATALAAIAPVTHAYAGDPVDVLRGE